MARRRRPRKPGRGVADGRRPRYDDAAPVRPPRARDGTPARETGLSADKETIMATFFSDKSQALFDDVLWLPQAGARTSAHGRPPNSYAILTNEGAIFVDAVFSWTLDGVHAVADAGVPPAAFVLTHGHLLQLGDALETLAQTYNVPFLLHPADADRAEAGRLGRAFMDPRQSDVLKRAQYDVLEMPYHTPGSIMLHTDRNRGVLFTGESGIAPGPDQAPDPARMERPPVATDALDAAFREAWQVLKAQRLVSSFLPLHGTPYVDRHDNEEISGPLKFGAPMDGTMADDVDPGEDHAARSGAHAAGVAD
jgi:glyoxylase-like metal-dependent hydrolase (beta-lactamase superfamily II)